MPAVCRRPAVIVLLHAHPSPSSRPCPSWACPVRVGASPAQGVICRQATKEPVPNAGQGSHQGSRAGWHTTRSPGSWALKLLAYHPTTSKAPTVSTTTTFCRSCNVQQGWPPYLAEARVQSRGKGAEQLRGTAALLWLSVLYCTSGITCWRAAESASSPAPRRTSLSLSLSFFSFFSFSSLSFFFSFFLSSSAPISAAVPPGQENYTMRKNERCIAQIKDKLTALSLYYRRWIVFLGCGFL